MGAWLRQRGDLSKDSAEDLARAIKESTPTKAIVIVAMAPPCQDFSLIRAEGPGHKGKNAQIVTDELDCQPILVCASDFGRLFWMSIDWSDVRQDPAQLGVPKTFTDVRGVNTRTQHRLVGNGWRWAVATRLLCVLLAHTSATPRRSIDFVAGILRPAAGAGRGTFTGCGTHRLLAACGRVTRPRRAPS